MRYFLQHILFVTVAVLFAACEKDDTLILPDNADTSSFPEAEAGEVRLVLADGSTRTPFEGMTLQGECVMTVVNGKVVYRR